MLPYFLFYGGYGAAGRQWRGIVSASFFIRGVGCCGGGGCAGAYVGSGQASGGICFGGGQRVSGWVSRTGEVHYFNQILMLVTFAEVFRHLAMQ